MSGSASSRDGSDVMETWTFLRSTFSQPGVSAGAGLLSSNFLKY
jgi:hypothetical protein